MGARILVVDDSPTIRRVVASILSEGAFEPLLAGDGQEALDLLSTESVDLVLLDFVMPRMNGYQFCREIRAIPNLRHLPVVLMSAKGDRIRGQFVNQTGALDAITKPFDRRGLLAVVDAALKKHAEGRERPLPEPDAMPADEAALESLRPSRNLSDDPKLRRLQAAQEFAQAVARLVVPELRRLDGLSVRPGAADRLENAFQRALGPEAIDALASFVSAGGFGRDPREVLSGELSAIPIAEVLQLLDLQQQSGALFVRTPKEEVTVFLRGGSVDFARYQGQREEFRIGRYLIEDGTVTRPDFERVLGDGGAGLIGERLVAQGLADEAAVRRALERQTSELVYEVVRWKSGQFSFVPGVEDGVASKASLALESGSLVMEGFRRVDEWRLIEGSFDFDEVLYPDPVAIERLGSEANLTKQERAVLDAIDGEHTIREIVDSMGGSSFELCKIVFQFLNSRLVRRRAA
ncbi:MAG: response regulator [Pseudomonadota bacterium]|nr:MAG: response regulator [Pseudomonadota bacterium]